MNAENPDSLPVVPGGRILVYQEGALDVQVRLEGETVWLTQRLMADLFQVSVKTANENLKNIYREGELDPGASIRKFRIVQTEGTCEVSRTIEHYSLDALLEFNERKILKYAGTVSAEITAQRVSGTRQVLKRTSGWQQDVRRESSGLCWSAVARLRTMPIRRSDSVIATTN
jgi:hypothetical protein